MTRKRGLLLAAAGLAPARGERNARAVPDANRSSWRDVQDQAV